MSDNDQNTPLSTRHAAAAAAMLESGGVVAAAARLCGLSSKTLYRYLDDPEFTKLLHAGRAAALQASVSRLTLATGAAVDVLVGIAGNKKAAASVRVQAATQVLSFAGRFVEQLDILPRLEALEAAQNGKR